MVLYKLYFTWYNIIIKIKQMIRRGWLSDKQKYCARKKLIKYNKQLARLANQ